MAEYRYYLIPDFMSHVFPQQFEEQAPTEFFSNTADLMKRYKQLREMPYNNEYTWNERTNLPYPRLTVGIDRRDPDGAVTIMQVRNGINYLCDDYRGPFADRNDKPLIEMAKQLVTAVGVDRIRPHYYTEENGHTKVHVGKDIHITEWANAPELCRALHFSRFLNRDGQQLFQVRNGQRIIENYADGSRLVKDVQTVDDTHFYVGSRFYHIQQYANQCFKRGCYVEPEHPQPGDKLDRLLIYQIPHYTCEYRFTDCLSDESSHWKPSSSVMKKPISAPSGPRLFLIWRTSLMHGFSGLRSTCNTLLEAATTSMLPRLRYKPFAPSFLLR